MKNKEMPTKVKILHHEYKIVIDEDLEPYGECDADRNEITIRANLPESLQKETLLHEILHACIAIGQTPLYPDTIHTLLSEDDWNHRFIYALENTLMGVLRENKELINYLQN